MEESIISDIRTDLKYYISKFQKSKAKEQLITAIYSYKLEMLVIGLQIYLFWTFTRFMEIILVIHINIHYGNPKLTIYIEMRYKILHNIKNGYQSDIIN